MATLAELMIKVAVDADDMASGLMASTRSADKAFSKVEGDAEVAGLAIDQAGEKAEKAFDGLPGSLSRTESALRGVGDDADRAAGDMASAGREGGSKFASGIESGVSGVGSAVESAGSAASSAVASGFDVGQVASSLSGMIEGLAGTLGPVGAVVGAGVGTALVVGILEGADREKAGDQLAARLTLDPEEQRRAGEVAGALYTGAYVSSVGEGNVVIDALLSSIEGLREGTERELEAAGVHATDFANIWETDVVEAVGAAGILIEQDLARNTEDAFNQMQVAMSRTPAQFRDELIPAIQEYAGHVTSLGITGPEMLGLMAKSAEDFGTIGIDKAGDALKEFALRATDTATSTADAFDVIGLDMGEMQTKLLAGGDKARGAFDEIVSAILDIEDPVAQAQAAVDLFGTPIEDLSKEQIPEFLTNLASMDTGLGDTADAMDNAGEIANDNLSTRLESLKNTAMSKLVDFIDTKVIPAFNAIKGWAQDNPALFQAVIIGVVALAAALAVLAIALIGVGIAALPITAPMLLIAAIVAGLIAVVALLVIHWDTLKEAAAAAWGWIQEKASQAFNWIKTNWPLLLGILTGPIGLAVLAIVKHRDKIWGAIKAVFRWLRDNWTKVLGFITGPIGIAAAVVVAKWGWIKARFTDVKNWIGARIGDIVGFFRGLPGRVGGFITTVKTKITGALTAAKDWVSGRVDDIVGFITGIPGRIGDIGGQIFDKITGGLGGFAGEVMSVIGFDTGGMVPGPRGAPRLIMAHGGETVLPTHDNAAMSGLSSNFIPMPSGLRSMDGGGQPIIVNVAGSIRSDKEIVALIRDELNFGGLRGSIRGAR